MIVLILSACALFFGAGYFTAHEFSKSEVLQIENAIITQKAEAQALISSIAAKSKQQAAQQIIANQELENARNSSMRTINAYDRQLDSMRLRDAGRRTGSGLRMSEADYSRLLKSDEADKSELSNELDQFLKSEAYRSDQTAIEKNSLLNFVQSGCGLSK